MLCSLQLYVAILYSLIEVIYNYNFCFQWHGVKHFVFTSSVL